MDQPITGAILIEIDCTICNGTFSNRYNPGDSLSSRELQYSKMITQIKKCPYCKKEITYEIPAVLAGKEIIFRGGNAE